MGDRRRIFLDFTLFEYIPLLGWDVRPPCDKRARAPRHVSFAQTYDWCHDRFFRWVGGRPVTFDRHGTAQAAAARDRCRCAVRDRPLLAAILPCPPASPYAVHAFSATAGLQSSLAVEPAADPLEFARLSRSVSPDLESALPHTGLGLRFAASFIYPHLLPQMHETGFCATPTRLRELRLAAVQMHAAAGRLQRAWQRATLTRSAVEVTRLLAACVLIQSVARGFLVRLPALIAEDEAWAAEHDEAGPLPIHWDWYRLPTGERCFFHIDLNIPMLVESSVERGQGWGRLGDLTFPPHWPPPWMQAARIRCGLPAARHPPPAPSLDADSLSDYGSDYGADLGESGAFSDCELSADEW